ncbi:capsule biosynthesis protein [Pseudorhodobacter turbinis]|uniref:Capsule biosynthesis protein n=1 Tax=Pseudorhodobacter turbinis TaxID=2500533 RepID=A0A4P8EFD6_9RHOB|nr:capsule biosynthesis protein [Pseudorhodobacter turbinis]QCO55821.1 capsule biosynthesis protein [Pseudorhodobacter turbinis]
MSEEATPSAEKPAAKPRSGPSGVQKMPRQVGREKKGKRRLALSFILLFVVPALFGGVYYTFLASDRYAAGASFVVRGLESGGPSDLVSSFTGLASTGSTTSDSYIIRKYMLSPDLLRALDSELQLQEHFSNPDIDFISRFPKGVPFEDFVEYWQRRITTTYDSTAGIVSFEVQAFDPEMAHKLAEAVLSAADDLINELSEKARLDSLRFATNEVELAEGRLFAAQIALRELRSSSGSFNPTVNAQLDAELIARLDTQLADLNARIQILRASVDPSALVLRQLVLQAEALQEQIDQRRAAMGSSETTKSGAVSADALSKFEGLSIEQTFAQQRYASALSSLESARMDAGRQQRYLAVFARPFKPDDAVYPYRIRDSLLVAALAFAIWGIGSLVVFAVRDHLR